MSETQPRAADSEQTRAADPQRPAREVPTEPANAPKAPALKSMKPLDPPAVPFALGGMAVWLVAWLVTYLVLRDSHPSWPAICIAGFLLGFPGLAVMIVHDRRRRERHNQTGPAESSNEAASPDVG